MTTTPSPAGTPSEALVARGPHLGEARSPDPLPAAVPIGSSTHEEATAGQLPALGQGRRGPADHTPGSAGAPSTDTPILTTLTNGAYALELIQRQTRRLGKLQPEVMADADPEPLHQLRVSLRRLRTALRQFAPALELPGSVSESRIASVARRTGLTRDLDVLRERLEQRILPALPEGEQEAFAPAIRRLARDRRQSFESLREALHSSRYLKLLARLHKWQRKPRFTAIGESSLQRWLFEWLVPISSPLFLHPGWFCDDPRAKELHDLRKRIKGVRYASENLEPFLDDTIGAWIRELKQAQDNLGDLHDLQVLAAALSDRSLPVTLKELPEMGREIQRQQAERWRQWQEQAQRLSCEDGRRAIHQHLLRLA
jgi:CHAD domain-containing protein